MKEIPTKQVLIKRTNPGGLMPIYVNDLIVTHSKNEFFITFSQIEHPAILSEEKFEDVNTIDSIAISKIVVNPEFFIKMLDVLQTNFRVFAEKQTEESENK